VLPLLLHIMVRCSGMLRLCNLKLVHQLTRGHCVRVKKFIMHKREERTTEYTQSGNGHFLAYISSMVEKLAQAGDGGGGWVHAHPLSLYLRSRTKLLCTLQLRRKIHFSYFYSTPYMYYVEQREGTTT
jgi:hypothetical protein